LLCVSKMQKEALVLRPSRLSVCLEGRQKAAGLDARCRQRSGARPQTRDQMSYFARQIRPSVSYWLNLFGAACSGPHGVLEGFALRMGGWIASVVCERSTHHAQVQRGGRHEEAFADKVVRGRRGLATAPPRRHPLRLLLTAHAELGVLGERDAPAIRDVAAHSARSAASAQGSASPPP
jgi:hypothetical protein